MPCFRSICYVVFLQFCGTQIFAANVSKCATFLKAAVREHDPHRPWVAVFDPASSGRLLVPELRKRNLNILQIVTNPFPNVLIPTLSDDFDARILYNGDIDETATAVLPYKPIVIFVGTETAAVPRDQLGQQLNSLGLSLEVNEVEFGLTDKHRMNQVLANSDLPHIEEKLARSAASALRWIKRNHLFPGAVVFKPSASAATDGFEIARNPDEVLHAFNAINGKTNILNRRNKGVLVQPHLSPPEIVPNLVIRDFNAILTDAWEYEKRELVVNGKTVVLYKVDWLLDPEDPRVIEAYNYVVAASRALKNRYGFAHPEIMQKRLVDYGARIMGGQPRVTLAATDHSQVDIGVEAALDPAAFARRFERQRFYARKRHAAVYSVMTTAMLAARIVLIRKFEIFQATLITTLNTKEAL